MEGAPMGNRVTQALLMDAAACGELGDGRTRGEEEEPKLRASPVGNNVTANSDIKVKWYCGLDDGDPWW
uniref:Uncharacterized protein n=1 Tax=Oryza rufipogon TaxID=4529 RepID=A0A0E0P521_ORYRU